jgi:carbonic anhydrase
MKSYERLLLSNKAWANQVSAKSPEYFEKLAKSQTPEFMWIGCSDSRVPADQVTGTLPGEIFVQRNVANLVVHTDINLLSVLQYAVEVLKVKHILVVGHYECGGVKAAMGNQDLGIINKWLRNIKDVIFKHEAELNAISDEDAKFKRLVELNVIEQVKNLAKTSIVQRAWQKNEYPHLHGWVMDLETGLINSIFDIDGVEDIEPIYRYQY